VLALDQRMLALAMVLVLVLGLVLALALALELALELGLMQAPVPGHHHTRNKLYSQ